MSRGAHTPGSSGHTSLCTTHTTFAAPFHRAVAFIQMLKACTPIATMALSFVFRLEQPTAQLVAAVMIITVGVMGASYGGCFDLMGHALRCESARLG